VLKIVFENENFLAVDKPAGWLSVPGRTGASDPRPCLSDEVKRLRPGALQVHRLDSEVTGLMLFARNADAHRTASLWFEGHQIQKYYSAWTEGARPPEAGPLVWESRLERGKKRAYEAPHGKRSSTRATWLREQRLTSGAKAQVWRLEPRTGRSHQLRYELAKHGFPVLGDRLYGATTSWREHEIALRAVRISFEEAQGATGLGLPDLLAVGELTDG